MFTLTKNGHYQGENYGETLFESNDFEEVIQFLHQEHTRIGICEEYINDAQNTACDIITYNDDDGEWVEEEMEWFTITNIPGKTQTKQLKVATA